LARELGDVRGTAFGSINLAAAVTRQGDLDAGRAMHDESLALIREIGDRWMEAYATGSFAEAIGRAGEREEARVLHLHALGILERLGGRRGVAQVRTQLAGLETL